MEKHIFISEEDLRKVVADEVREAVSQALPEAIRRATAKAYLSKSDLKELTGWSDRQIEYKKAKREITFVKQGRLVLFPTAEIIAYLELGRVPRRRR